jgi:hypothetical protein
MSQNDEPEEKVGYRKPPRRTQFKKGQSGNPKGRPRKSKNFATLLRQQLEKPVTVTENGRRKKVTMLQAMVALMTRKGLSGDTRTQKMLIDLIREIERGDGFHEPIMIYMSETDRKLL